jgi:hypothetical protein
MPAPTIKPKTTGKVETQYVDFDPNNPRLIEQGLKKPTDAQIVRALADNADLSEIVQSIAANGYIDIEPLIVQRDKSRYVVLEGNRRLAAIRVIQDPELARSAGISVPKTTKEVRDSLEEVTVYAVSDPDQARDFIGFKHINGPHKWDAHAKGRLPPTGIAKREKNGITLETSPSARRRPRYRPVVRHHVLDQAEKGRSFQSTTAIRQFAFSHLYTALTRPGYREFLGLPDEWRANDPKPNPVPKARVENLGKVLVWLYGSKSDDVEPVITSQNPHIKQLGAVLQDARARAILINRNSLSEAHQQLEPKGARFETALLNAKQEAENALSQVIGYDTTDTTLLETAAELKQTSAVLFTTMSGGRIRSKTGSRSPPSRCDRARYEARRPVGLSARLLSMASASAPLCPPRSETEEQEEDIADEDARHESLVGSVQSVIAERRKIIGPDDYPFIIDDDGSGMQRAAPVTPAGAIYLFCLFLSHAYDRTIIPKEHAPDITHEVRDLFQICATVAAAGYVEGIATSFGWPRPDSEKFLAALKRIYGMFGDGTPHGAAPIGAPDQVKDDGIDVIAWRPSPDGLPGTHYLLGQVASGNDWQGKSVVNYIDMFHKFWFSTPPASREIPVMFMPFCLEPKAFDDPSEAQESAVNNMQRLTNFFGVLIYRYRCRTSRPGASRSTRSKATWSSASTNCRRSMRGFSSMRISSGRWRIHEDRRPATASLSFDLPLLRDVPGDVRPAQHPRVVAARRSDLRSVHGPGNDDFREPTQWPKGHRMRHQSGRLLRVARESGCPRVCRRCRAAQESGETVRAIREQHRRNAR